MSFQANINKKYIYLLVDYIFKIVVFEDIQLEQNCHP